jgi:hypothetical protein
MKHHCTVVCACTVALVVFGDTDGLATGLRCRVQYIQMFGTQGYKVQSECLVKDGRWPSVGISEILYRQKDISKS